MERISVTSLANKIQTEADAYALLESMRWGDPVNPVCPHCGYEGGAYFIRPMNGTSRKTNRGTTSQRRLWCCRVCRKQFSVLTGTIFHGTHISVRTWLFVLFEMCANKNGISAREIERKYDLTAKSAWFMTQRIREAMKREPLVGMLRGTIVADETFIGGLAKNKHRAKREALSPYTPGESSKDDKIPVLSLVNKETGEVRSHVVADVTGATLRKVMAEQVDMAGSVLHTDALNAYLPIGAEFIEHQSVNHSDGEYVRGDVTTNQAEGYFSQLKRSIDGTHHHVSREHLPRYLAEFDFRYSTRRITDTARMAKLVDQVEGRRLSYKPLTGR
jgi:transposase-like protein